MLSGWKPKEAPQKSWGILVNNHQGELTSPERILPLLADYLITWVCEEHALSTKVRLRRRKFRGSPDALEFQNLEQVKADVLAKVLFLTGKVEDILRTGQEDDEERFTCEDLKAKHMSVHGYLSSFFSKFDEKEFELGLCAILLLEKLEDGIGVGQ